MALPPGLLEHLLRAAEAPRPPKPKRRVVIDPARSACTRCANVKMRCEMLDPARQVCKRCARSGDKCEWRQSGRGRWKRPKKAKAGRKSKADDARGRTRVAEEGNDVAAGGDETEHGSEAISQTAWYTHRDTADRRRKSAPSAISVRHHSSALSFDPISAAPSTVSDRGAGSTYALPWLTAESLAATLGLPLPATSLPSHPPPSTSTSSPSTVLPLGTMDPNLLFLDSGASLPPFDTPPPALTSAVLLPPIEAAAPQPSGQTPVSPPAWEMSNEEWLQQFREGDEINLVRCSMGAGIRWPLAC